MRQEQSILENWKWLSESTRHSFNQIIIILRLKTSSPQDKSVKISNHNSKGFTLLELLIVITIIGVLIGIVAPKVIGRGDDARQVAALNQVKVIENALKEYRIDNSRYPTTEQGLDALITKPESEPIPNNWKKYWSKRKMPKDPWGRKYQYRFPGEKEDIDVFSLGKDKDSDKDDIGNWEADSEEIDKE